MIETANLPWVLPLSALALALSVVASGVVGSWLRIHRILAGFLLMSLGIILAGTLSPLAAEDIVPPRFPRACDTSRTWLPSSEDLASGNDVVTNILMLMPLGFAVGAVALSRRKIALMAAAIALPFAIEGLQLLVVVLGRGCESADVVDNLTGLFIGFVAGTPISWLQPPLSRTRRAFGRGREHRVLFLAPYLGDGGINTHMLSLGTELRKLGWEVAICSGGTLNDPAHVGAADVGHHGTRSPAPEDYERAEIRHFDASVPASPRGLRELPRLLLIPVAAWQVLWAVRRFRPDIVHSHSRQMGLYARIAELVLGVPYISSVHSPVTPRSRQWAATTFLGAEAIAVSDEVRAGLVRNYRARPDRVRVIPPAADPEHFRPPTPEERRAARARWQIEPDQFVLAFVGSLTLNKQPEALVEAVADLRAAQHDAIAIIAGRGPARAAVTRRAVELGVADHVHLLGYQDPLRVLWAADAFVLPSRSEGSPLAVVEAMLSGVVVVATPAGGAAQQLTPGVTGMSFEHGNHRDLAHRVEQLIADPALRDALTGRARQHARDRYSSPVMARQVAQTYVDALEASGRSVAEGAGSSVRGRHR